MQDAAEDWPCVQGQRASPGDEGDEKYLSIRADSETERKMTQWASEVTNRKPG